MKRAIFTQSNQVQQTRSTQQSGNVLFIILLAIVLLGLLTAVVFRSENTENASIRDETMVIRVTEAQRYVAEVERAVRYILQDGKSESEIRFAHLDADSDYGDITSDTDQSDQVFSRDGGGATYQSPPDDINDGSAWEFYGGTHAPGVGRADRAELIAVLPHVTEQFCDKVNAVNHQSGTMLDDGATSPSGSNPGSCVYMGDTGRFGDSDQFFSTINTMNTASTSFEHDDNTNAVRPALQGCVTCAIDTDSDGNTDDEMHFYSVILAR